MGLGSISAISTRWWKEDKEKVHNAVFEYVKHIRRAQSYKTTNNLRYLRLFSNYELLGLGASTYSRQDSNITGLKNRVTLNVIQSMCETVTSKITKNKPAPTFLTDGGNWSEQQRAKKLNKFLQGQFHHSDLYQKASLAFLESCIFGTGAVKIFRQDNKIKTERVFIDEILVDDVESVYSNPRQMHQVKVIHRDVLKEMFPKFQAQIDNAKQSVEGLSGSNELRGDMVEVVESWHLPSGDDADDGKHAISIDNQTLLCEEYKKPYFPFIFFRWTVRPLGFFGQGLAEQLQGIQLEINKILKTIQVSMHLTSVPKVFVEASSKVISAHLNNEIGGIVKYLGTKPSYESVGSIPGELFSHLDRLYDRAFEIAGISQLSATSLKPAGLDSGKALREFNDIETERFMAVGQRYEQAFIDAGKIMIDLMGDIAKDSNDFSIKVPSGKFLETISWDEVNLDEDKYIMQVFPTSSLSSHPSGRLQDVQELIAAGFIDKNDGRALLNFPDLESVTNLETAATENIERAVESMIEKGEYVPPEPFQNLELGLKKVQESYLLFQNRNAPDERLELLRRWMEDAKALLDKAAQAEQAQQAAIEAVSAQAAAPQDLGALPPENLDAGALPPEDLGALPPEDLGAALSEDLEAPLPT